MIRKGTDMAMRLMGSSSSQAKPSRKRGNARKLEKVSVTPIWASRTDCRRCGVWFPYQRAVTPLVKRLTVVASAEVEHFNQTVGATSAFSRAQYDRVWKSFTRV